MIDDAFLAALDLAPAQISVAADERDDHAADYGMETRGRRTRPDVVVYPESTADVAAVLSTATDHGVPVTPYAAGTGLEGGAMPGAGGVSLDLTRMDAVLDVRPADRQIDVQPGVLGGAVDDAVAAESLFFPPQPASGAISTVGGMIATDASGTQTVKYGEVADWVLGLEVILADGTVLETGTRATKTSSGYNLTDLMVGSEGTLGVVTRATLELTPRPTQVRGARAVFESLDDATAAIAAVNRAGVDVARMELLDSTSVAIANAYLDADLPDAPLVFLEFHAMEAVEATVDACRRRFEAHDVARFDVADRDEMEQLWRVRNELGYAIPEYDPVRSPIHNGDVTVPIGAYPTIVAEAQSLSETHDVVIPFYGHAGDGNLHYTILVDPDDPDERALGERLYADLVHRALELGGTATGEHGIGVCKRPYLEPEHGDAAVDVMRTIKAALDPSGILNPGTIFPDDHLE